MYGKVDFSAPLISSGISHLLFKIKLSLFKIKLSLFKMEVIICSSHPEFIMMSINYDEFYLFIININLKNTLLAYNLSENMMCWNKISLKSLLLLIWGLNLDDIMQKYPRISCLLDNFLPYIHKFRMKFTFNVKIQFQFRLNFNVK